MIAGTASTTLSKVLYDTEAKGVDGDIHKFQKPMFTNFAMFLGMSCCLLIAGFRNYIRRRQHADLNLFQLV